MRELTGKKKLEILRLFFEGYSYDEISTKSDVSKGSVVNVVNDLRDGRFPAFTMVAYVVDVLRDLSVELKKRGVGVSKTLLGNAFFFRLSDMGVTPEKLDLWVKMNREMSPPEAPLRGFTAAALELFRLTQETGESYESIVTRWTKLQSESDSLERKVTDLRAAKSELDRTRATLTEEIKTLNAKKSDLNRAAAELSTRHEALKKASSDLDTRYRRLKTETAQLEAKSTALGPVVERLETLGFGTSELKTLRAKLEEVASSQGISPQDLREKFFKELAAYGVTLTFEKKKDELQVVAIRLEAKVQSLQKAAVRLGPPEEVDEAIGCLASLKKKGIIPAAVTSYYRVLSQAQIEPKELEHEVIELGGLKNAIASRSEAVRHLKDEEAKRAKVVEALRAEEAGVKAAIQELTKWAQRVIEESRGTALSAVEQATQRMAEDIRAWGDARAELQVYLDDLKRARYFTRLPLSNEALDSYIQDMSPLVVSQGLQIILLWCVRKLNLKFRPPTWVVRKYYNISQYTDVELVDLVRWSLEAFAEGVTGNEGRT
jgi:hypothetical protein